LHPQRAPAAMASQDVTLRASSHRPARGPQGRAPSVRHDQPPPRLCIGIEFVTQLRPTILCLRLSLPRLRQPGRPASVAPAARPESPPRSTARGPGLGSSGRAEPAGPGRGPYGGGTTRAHGCGCGPAAGIEGRNRPQDGHGGRFSAQERRRACTASHVLISGKVETFETVHARGKGQRGVRP